MMQNKKFRYIMIVIIAIASTVSLIQYLFTKNNDTVKKDGVSINSIGVIRGTIESPLKRPLSVAVGENGEIYVADSSNHRIQVFSMEGTFIKNIGGPGTADGQFDYPTAVATYGHKIYVADSGNNRVQIFNQEGRFINKLYTIENKVKNKNEKNKNINKYKSVLNQSAYELTLAKEVAFKPLAIALDSAENIYIADGLGQRILIYNSKGKLVKAFGEQGIGTGQFGFPNGISIDEKGKSIYISDFANGRIQVFDMNGKFSREIKGAGEITNPRGIAYDSERKILFVADIFEHRISIFKENGTFLGFYGSIGNSPKEFHFPNGLFLFKQTLYVADRENNRIMVLQTR